jgi:peptide/nickel transport system substrate-binding protein
MEAKRMMTRREFIRLSTLAGASVAIAACAPATVAPTTAPAATNAPAATSVPAATQPPAATKPPAATQPPVSKYKQAPSLDQLVKDGKLAPVEKRLPENPWVQATLTSTGKYGGMIRRAYQGASDRWGPTKLIDKGLVWFDKSLVVKPRIAESWTTNATGTEWTFKLRKGLKWSDGKDFTTADVVWTHNNVYQSKLLNPGTDIKLTTGPKKTFATISAADAYTFTYKFADPKPMLPILIGRSNIPIQYCEAEYCKQFHRDLMTSDADKTKLDDIVKKSGQASWDLYWINIATRWDQNPDLPVLGPWYAKEALGKDIFTMVRNPYFGGVDSDGNQLPYVDVVQHRQYSSASMEVFKLWVTNGEIDFQARQVPVSATDYTNFKQSETKGDYKVYKGVSASHLAVQLNLGTKNKKLREVFNDRNFRLALSQAMNRDQINELVFSGLCTPRQYSPVKASPQYYDKLTNAYIKFDVTAANKLLDDAGYKKGADGFRMFKDGSGPITFIIENTDATGTPNEDAYQQVVKAWNAVGIKATYKYVERALYSTHYLANDLDAASWGGDRTVLPFATEAVIFRGVQNDRPWSGAFGLWYINNSDQNGEKPPADHFINKIWSTWDQVAAEPDPAKQNTLFQGILDIWATELPMIGVLGELPSFCIVKNGLKNFVDGFPNDDPTSDEHIYCTETLFWDDPSKHPVPAA